MLPFKGCTSLNSVSVWGPMFSRFNHPDVDLRCFFFLIPTVTQPHSIMLPPLLLTVVRFLKSSKHTSLNGQTAQSFSNLRNLTFCRNPLACSCWKLEIAIKSEGLSSGIRAALFAVSNLTSQWTVIKLPSSCLEIQWHLGNSSTSSSISFHTKFGSDGWSLGCHWVNRTMTPNTSKFVVKKIKQINIPVKLLHIYLLF